MKGYLNRKSVFAADAFEVSLKHFEALFWLAYSWHITCWQFGSRSRCLCVVYTLHRGLNCWKQKHCLRLETNQPWIARPACMANTYANIYRYRLGSGSLQADVGETLQKMSSGIHRCTRIYTHTHTHTHTHTRLLTIRRAVGEKRGRGGGGGGIESVSQDNLKLVNSINTFSILFHSIYLFN